MGKGMVYNMNTVYLISGACGCGKSTLAKSLSKESERTFFIEGDILSGFFCDMGQAPWDERLRITWDNIISLTQNALRNRLNVIIDYVVEDELPRLLQGLKEFDYELRYIVLLADEGHIRARIETRGDVELIPRALFLREQLMHTQGNISYILDNTELNTEEVRKQFLAEPRFIYRTG